MQLLAKRERDTNEKSTIREKREDNRDYSCPNSSFSLHGSKCFIGVLERKIYTDAGNACEVMGAKLASIGNSEEDDLTSSILENKNRWIGLNDMELEGTFVWSDSSDFFSRTGPVVN